MAVDHAVMVKKVKDAMAAHKGKGMPQVEARLRAWADGTLANARELSADELQTEVAGLEGDKEAIIRGIMDGV